MQVDVIRKVTTQYSAVGADQYSQKTRDAGRAHSEMATAVRGSTNVVSEQEVAMARWQRQMEINARASQQFAAANDNVARGFAETNRAMQESKSSLLETAEGVLSTVSHFKLLAVAAYALSPAVRSFTNSGVAAGLSALGSSAGVVSAAFGRIVSVAAPALSFLSRIAIPITLAVTAFKLLNETWSRGSELLEKYGKSQRELYGQNVLKGYGSGIDGKDVTSGFVGAKSIEDATAQLTRFQNETLSAQQVQYATQLGARLAEAKRIQEEFFKVSLDLTNPALRLQNAWVVINETIAKTLGLIERIPGGIQSGLQAVGNSSIWDKLNWGWKLPGALTPDQAIARMNGDSAQQQQVTQEQAFDLAKKKLAAGMGGGFTGRWSQSMYDLANPPEKDKTKDTDAWTRFVDQVTKATAAVAANTETVGLSAAAHEKRRVELQGESVLEREGVADTEARRAKLAELAKQAGETAGALEKAKITDKIEFDKKTAFLGAEDVQIAHQLRGLYNNDIPAALNSTEAAEMRATNGIRAMTDAASNFASNIIQAFAAGKTGAEALLPAISSLGSAMTKIGTDALTGGLKSLLNNGTFSADPASLAIGGAGMLLSFITGNAQKKKQDAADRAAAAQRGAQYSTAAQLAGIDQTNLAGALQAFDVQAVQTRLQEAQQKYPQMAALEQQLAAQRLAIQKQFNEQMIAESKKILDYLQGLKLGSSSILNPQDKLAAAQSSFDAQLALAKGGDFKAIQGITQVAQALLDQAQSFFASSGGYADVYSKTTASLQGVAGRAAQGLASGGMVGNGVYGLDSVRARYAGGGDIMLAGHEFVNRSQSVNSSTLPTLDYINRTGSVPANDNGRYFDNLARVMGQGFNGLAVIFTGGFETLGGRVKKLEDAMLAATADARQQRRKTA